MLKIEVDWTRLSKEDLDSVVKVLGDPGKLVQLGVKAIRNKAKEEWLNRPLREVLENLEGLHKEKRRGPLGFGILPAIFGTEEHEEEKKP